MREILFRGKRLDNDEMVEGNLFIPDQIPSRQAPTEILVGTNVVRISFKVDPTTVSQFSGLCDKNGKKIFEGDILHRWSEYCEEYVGTCVVKYGKFNCGCCDGVYGWYLDGGDIRDFNSDYPADYEVCGNIYDHPELLEVPPHEV